MKKIISVIFLTAAFSVSPEATLAEDMKTPMQQNFAALDQDEDGAISIEEAADDDALAEAFSDFDADGDEQLNEEEYNQYLANLVKKSG